MSPADGPLGRHRSPGLVILWMILTLGIYGLYWFYITFAELQVHRGEGVSGLVGMLLAFIPVSIFLLPSYVGRAYHESAQDPPVSGLTGVWAIVPIVGSFIWVFKVQGALNRYWEGKAEVGTETPAAEAPAS